MSNPFDMAFDAAVPPVDSFAQDFDLGAKRPKPEVEVVAFADRKNPVITAPGFYPDVTPDQYFAEPCPAPALTNSGIQLLAPVGAAPAKFAYNHPAIGQPPVERESTAAQYRGSLVHRLALDKGKEFVVSPYDAYRTQEAKDWRDAIKASGRMPVKENDLDVARAMADLVRPNIVEACQGHPYETEVVIAWKETVALTSTLSVEVWCRAMLDVWCQALNLGLDVKTTRSADDDTITKAFNNGYAIQDKWYLRGINALSQDKGRARFGFLFVESDAPHLPRPVSSTEAYRHGAGMMIERGLWLFARGLHHNEWQGYEPLRPQPSAWFLAQCEAAAQDNGQ